MKTCSIDWCRKAASDNRLEMCADCWAKYDSLASQAIRDIFEAKRDEKNRN